MALKNYGGLVFTLLVIISSMIVTMVQSQEYSKKLVSKTPSVIGSSISEFSFDLFKILVNSSFQTPTSPENVLFSPSSAFRALLLLRFASGGNSEAQINKALHIEDVSNIAEEYSHCKNSTIGGVLEADRLYYDSKSVNVTGDINTLLGSDIEGVNMGANKTVDEINDWVSKVTEGQIRKLIDQIENDVKIILLSAIYMRADWEYPFRSVTSSPFTLTDSSTIDVPMMFVHESFMYESSKTLQSDVIALGYKNSPLKFVVFLPNKNKNLSSLVNSMTRELIDTTIEKMYNRKVNVHLPKFKVEKDIKLIPLCKALGITDVFESETADFTSFQSDVGLYIKDVSQKVVVEVDRNGTTAAASTVVKASGRSLAPPVEFVANRPFMYMIYDTSSKTPLFMGTLVDPR